MTNTIKIKKIQFLTPAKIDLEIDGVVSCKLVGVDFPQRKVYEGDEESELSKIFFEHLDEITIMPENYFEASEELYEKAASSKNEHDDLYSNGSF